MNMDSGMTFHGRIRTQAWTGPTFTAFEMPMFYANRLGQATVPLDGHWGMRPFTDPVFTFGGGIRIDVTNRLYFRPDIRALGVPRLDALAALYAEIDAEVRHLYRIGYASDDERHDGQWRTVSVRVRSQAANVLGDVVLGIEGPTPVAAPDVQRRVRDTAPGVILPLAVWRDRQRIDVQVEVGTRPRQQ